MENKNFANWKITELLPDNKHSYFTDVYINPESKCATIDDLYGIENSESYTKLAWSWEDIRLYLKENGYSVNINSGIYGYDTTIFNDDDNFRYIFDSYEEARIEGIKYCLKLINKS